MRLAWETGQLELVYRNVLLAQFGWRIIDAGLASARSRVFVDAAQMVLPAASKLSPPPNAKQPHTALREWSPNAIRLLGPTALRKFGPSLDREARTESDAGLVWESWLVGCALGSERIGATGEEVRACTPVTPSSPLHSE